MVYCRSRDGKLRHLEVTANSLKEAQDFIADLGLNQLGKHLRCKVKNPVLVCILGGKMGGKGKRNKAFLSIKNK